MAFGEKKQKQNKATDQEKLRIVPQNKVIERYLFDSCILNYLFLWKEGSLYRNTEEQAFIQIG